jgi:hypothetical protein
MKQNDVNDLYDYRIEPSALWKSRPWTNRSQAEKAAPGRKVQKGFSGVSMVDNRQPTEKRLSRIPAARAMP